MTAGPRAIERHKLRAPREHGAALIEPPLSSVAAWLDSPSRAARLGESSYIAGIPLGRLAATARAELLEAAWRYTTSYRDAQRPTVDAPVLLAGHQPQLFHPGVWFKNFALGRLAERHGGVGINLVIDSDTLRSASLRVPGGTVDAPTLEAVPFDAPGPEIPFEERTILDRDLFDSFSDRTVRQMADLVPDPLLKDLWPLVLEQSRQTNNLGLSLAQGRHRLEGQWGLHDAQAGSGRRFQTLELPQSQVCQLGAFHHFVAHLLAEAPRLREVYNVAVHEYRRANRIRSASHPVPDLAADLPGDEAAIESPLWIWRTSDPRRRRLFVRRAARELILSDRQHDDIRLPSPDRDVAATVAALAALARDGVKLRTRALITTLWSRLALGDLFLHGIGGAKYDQVTDLLFARFFGLAPPGYLTVTATLHLPIARESVSTDDLHTIEQTLRELEFHPERHIDERTLPDDASRSQLARLRREKAAWIATPQTRDNARQRCHAIREANQAMQPWVEQRRSSLLIEREQLATRLRAAEVLASREHSFCLHPETSLRNFMLEFPPDRP